MVKQAAPILSFNLGLFLGVEPLMVPSRGLRDGENFRIKQGRVGNLNLGWVPFTSYGNTAATMVLLHFNGADASTVIREGALGAADKRWTVAGNAQLDTAQFKFGTSSLLLDGTGDWITTGPHTDFNLGGETEINIETQLRPAVDGSALRIAGQGPVGLAAASTPWYAERLANNTVRFHVSNGSAFTSLTTTGTVVAGVWTHVRLGLKNGTLSLARNGTVEATAAFAGTIPTATDDFRVGIAGEDTTTPWNGWIDEFKFEKGTGVGFDDDFTAPTVAYKRVLDGPVMLIDRFFIRGITEILMAATDTSLYSYDLDADQFVFRSPTYNTATVDVSAANPAVVNANTGTPNWITNRIKAGDKIAFEATALSEPDAQWYEIASVDAEGQLTLTTTVAGAAFTNVSYVIRRVFSNAVNEPFDAATFVAPDDGTGDDLWFITNGVDPIWTWDGSAATAIDRFSLGFTAKRLIPWKNMMIYGNILDNTGDLLPQDIINSDVGVPLDVTNGLASQFRVHDGVDAIMELEDLGDNLVIYAERHIVAAQFVGDPLVLTFREAASGVGPWASRVIADFGDYHQFLGHDAQYLFDGVAVTEVGKNVWREVLRLRDPVRNQHAFSHFDEENGDLHWAVPLTTDAGVGDETEPVMWAYVEHYLEEVDPRTPSPFSKRSMPFVSDGYGTTSGILTWDEMTGTWEDAAIRWNESFLFSAFPTNLVGTADGQIMTLNVSQTANGTLLPSFIRTGRRVLGDWRMRGLLTRIYPFTTVLPGPLDITVRMFDHATSETANVAAVFSYDTALADDNNHFEAIYRRGRFVEIEFGTDGRPWEMAGYDIDARPGGSR